VIQLKNKGIYFFLWSFTAAFLAYASMYAFRKPFNAATYESFNFFGFALKDVLIISQLIGYMLSKFIGIKVISELTKNQRVRLIILLIISAHIALLFFAIVPLNFKFLCLFLNGIPLGMVWGVIFSFLEGRKLTEMIATGIAVGAIVSSGLVKSFARYLMSNNHWDVSEFWMPFVTGLFFLPILLFAVWMLSKIPEPNTNDIIQKTSRKPLLRKDRKELLRMYLPGIMCLVLLYVALTVFRDFRDNYAVEILDQFGFTDTLQFARMELIIGVIVIVTTSFIAFFRNNRLGFNFVLLLISVGFLLMFVAYVLFKMDKINAYYLMLFSGLGMGMGYVPFQIALFERFIAVFRIRGNVGFLMYLSDSMGYLGSVILLLLKSSQLLVVSEFKIFEQLILFCSIFGLLLTIYSFTYFRKLFNH